MDLRKVIVEELLKHEILVEPEVVEYIIEKGGVDYLPSFLSRYGNSTFVSISSISPPKMEFREEVMEEKASRIVPAEKSTFTKPEGYEHDWDFKILIDPGYTQSSGKADDFRSLFLDRYKRISKYVRRNFLMRGATDIANITGGEVRIIGLVDELRTTSKGSLSFYLEDPTGKVKCIYQGENFLLNDEVIGVVGTYREDGNFVYVKEIVRPGFRKPQKTRRIAEPIGAVIISDVHIGSKMFMRKNWEKFISWLKNGKDGAEIVKYLIIGGDLVDGIGIYPNQEEELEIIDIYKQYEALANYLADLPDYIKVIMIPGNHDLVRNTEPQPPLPKDVQSLFNGNVEFLSNPSVFSLHGYTFLIYHGATLNDLVELIPGMSYENIGPIMRHMLEMRHLGPSYGGKVPIAPLPRDFLAIDLVPDVFITGHVHAFTYDNYKGVHMINASCWQAQTKYQKMMNFNPVPGKVALLNFHTDEVKILSF